MKRSSSSCSRDSASCSRVVVSEPASEDVDEPLVGGDALVEEEVGVGVIVVVLLAGLGHDVVGGLANDVGAQAGLEHGGLVDVLALFGQVPVDEDLGGVGVGRALHLHQGAEAGGGVATAIGGEDALERQAERAELLDGLGDHADAGRVGAARHGLGELAVVARQDDLLAKVQIADEVVAQMD